ncbi:AMP-binding protein [Saccharicrinis aurantiacus]|uniref:AMP-binding protein n=1 Tax=Saccharicrinis aurantiacus TaxID=1849719 RepID=UPI00094F8632|nr:AMP-binding protein [Saccharicrinis aurantiacus]
MGQFINTYHTLTLEGITRSGEILRDYCSAQLSDKGIADWEIAIYQFCLDWLSSDDTIVAQTSGSTGTPKEIQIQKKHMVASAEKTIAYFNLEPGDTASLPLSANYIAGKMMLVRAFVGRLNIIGMAPCSNPIAELKQHVNFAPLVPMQVINALQTVKGEWPVDTIIIGGGAISDIYKEQLRLKQTAFYETYGMTETVSHIALKNISESSFLALKGVSFSSDERECLCIDAPDVVSEKIVTNDIVQLNSQTSFSFIGRYDNVINTGGIKLVPEKLEAKIVAHLKTPFVISSLPNDLLGEELVLVYTDPTLTKAKLSDIFRNTKLTKYEMPRKAILLSQLPLTETEKVKRACLKGLIAKADAQCIMKKIIFKP